MPHEVEIVVLSNIEKKLPHGVELRVGLPTKNPWSLPFAHRSIFSERADEYDLFVYSEDDTLITAGHIDAFLQATQVLERDEIAGFLRSEEGPDGTLFYSTIHRHYHWDPASVVRRGDHTFAHFTNEHGACYLLTREQLHRAIASGGFCVAPHEGRYDMLVSAATDPYTQCGFRKLVCISSLENFTCKHLTNKYVGRTGLEKRLVEMQINALNEIGSGHRISSEPMRVHTYLPGTRWAKSYYEPRRDDLLGLVPRGAERILSLGCGWGETEASLIARGAQVMAIALDAVIAEVARSKGIAVVPASLADGWKHIAPGSLDVILVSGVLHLVDDPADILRRYGNALASDGAIVISVPNVQHLAVRLKRLGGASEFETLQDYERSGVHSVSFALVRAWIESAGLEIQHSEPTFAPRWSTYNKLSVGLVPGLWADEFLVRVRKRT